MALRLAWRVLILWVVEAAGLHLIASVLPGLELAGWEGAFLGAAAIGLANAILWPLLIRFALRIVIWTFGLAALMINAGLVLLVGELIPEFRVDGFWVAMVVAFGLAAINTVMSTLLAIEDDDSFYRRVIARYARRAGALEATDVPGVLFLEIDGLSIDTLRRAVRDGHAPTLARWLREGSHQLIPWECDLSSQTGASQAGLLHGSNDDMPAFRWYEKATGRVIVSNNPRDAAELERRHSNGNGLLARQGASRGNLFSGDADRSLVTLSTVLSGGRERSDIYAFLADPYSVTRTLVLAVADVCFELVAAARQRRRDVLPRVGRGGIYPLLRATTTVVLRDINVYTLVADVLRGVPVAYATFVGYDEVAHHSGVERADALEVLYKLDRQFARIERATRQAPRPYHLVVLSDHGQSQGATFKQRYGETLEEVVRSLIAGDSRVSVPATAEEAWGHVSAALTEISEADQGTVPRATRRLTRRRRQDGVVALGPDSPEARQGRGEHSAQEQDADVMVLASGNLGLVYLLGAPRRLSMEEIMAEHPDLIEGLAGHPGISFLMVRSSELGPLVRSAKGSRRLATGEVQGEDPLAPFGPNASRHLLRTDGFANAPDVLLNGRYEPATESVAAFEELVGSHGGLGGPQSRAFALVPSGWSEPDAPVVGAREMHERMVAWLREVGQ